MKAKQVVVPWIGVDLDGTLAYHDGGGVDGIGKPIPAMLDRVKFWVENGVKVKIFTARATYPEMIPPVQDWLESIGLPRLEVTNQKDFQMVQLWDDRAIQVVPNDGREFIHPDLIK